MFSVSLGECYSAAMIVNLNGHQSAPSAQSSDNALISLFSGAGGLDLGLEMAGFSTRVAVELDRGARQSLRDNQHLFGSSEFPIFDDITLLDPQFILDQAGLEPGEAALVAGGPPCQSFSTAGGRRSIGDPRGSLFKNFADVIEVAKPRFFVMENVRGMLSAAIKHRPLNKRGSDFPPLSKEEEPGSAFRVIRSEFEERLGYQISFGLVDAANYGVPQHRVRLIVIGSRDHELVSADVAPMLESQTVDSTVPLRTVLDGLNGTAHDHLNYSPDRHDIMKLVPPGKNWRWFRDNPDYGIEFTKKIMGGAWSSGGGKVGFFRRLDPDKPSPTLPTSPIQKSTALCHPWEDRPLSVQEYAAIQTFPPEFVFAGSVYSKYKQIGNAVPVRLGQVIGNAVISVAESSVSSTVQARLFEAKETYDVART